MAEKETQIGKAKMKQAPQMPISFKLKDKSVKTKHLEDKSVSPEKLSDDAIAFFENEFKRKIDDLQNQIDSYNEHGVSVSNEFGDDPHIGVSQKTITEAINKLWEKFEDITGEVLRGINMVVTPTYFISEDGCDIHISANTVETTGIFERIRFYIDNVLIYEDFNTEYASFNHHIDVKDDYTYVIMCKAKILGVEYTRQQIITRYNEFYIGAGSIYSDVMDSTHAKQLEGTMRHNYDVTFAEGNKLIIVMGAALREGFIRADLNGVEIQMEEQTVTIDGKQYVVLTSDPWSAGDYNIDING